MTLLGVPDSFQMGVASSAAPSSSMDVSLDDIIKARASAKSNVVDRAEGSRAARRNAVRNARRGLAASNKPTEPEIAKQVLKKNKQRAEQTLHQMQQTASQKKNHAPTDKAAIKHKLQEQRNIRQQQQVIKAAEQQLGEVIPRPTRAMVTAAKQAMVAAGYTFPPHTTLHVVPTQKNAAATATAAAATAPPSTGASTTTTTGTTGTRRRNHRGRAAPK